MTRRYKISPPRDFDVTQVSGASFRLGAHAGGSCWHLLSDDPEHLDFSRTISFPSALSKAMKLLEMTPQNTPKNITEIRFESGVCLRYIGLVGITPTHFARIQLNNPITIKVADES